MFELLSWRRGLWWLLRLSCFPLLFLVSCTGGIAPVTEGTEPEGRSARGVVAELQQAASDELRRTILLGVATEKRGDRLDFSEFWQLLTDAKAEEWLIPAHADALFPLERRSCESRVSAAFADFAMRSTAGRAYLIRADRVCQNPLSKEHGAALLRHFLTETRLQDRSTEEITSLVHFLDVELKRSLGENWFDLVFSAEEGFLQSLAKELVQRQELRQLLELFVTIQSQQHLVPYGNLLREKIFTDRHLVSVVEAQVGLAPLLQYLFAISRDPRENLYSMAELSTAPVVNYLLERGLQLPDQSWTAVWEHYGYLRGFLRNISLKGWDTRSRLALLERTQDLLETWLRSQSDADREWDLSEPPFGAFSSATSKDLDWMALTLFPRTHRVVLLAQGRVENYSENSTDPVERLLAARLNIRFAVSDLEKKRAFRNYCDVMATVAKIPLTLIPYSRYSDYTTRKLTAGCYEVVGGPVGGKIPLTLNTDWLMQTDSLVYSRQGAIEIRGSGKVVRGMVDNVPNSGFTEDL